MVFYRDSFELLHTLSADGEKEFKRLFDMGFFNKSFFKQVMHGFRSIFEK